MISNLLFAALLSASPLSSSSVFDPTMNLSAIREIECSDHYGSGWQIGDNIIVTALHVANGTGCKDYATGKPLTTYKIDVAHDLALMTGDLPKDKPYIKYSCAPYETDETYMAIGISGYGWGYSHPNRFMRMYSLTAQKNYTDEHFFLAGAVTPSPGLRIMSGRAAPGISGSPIVDSNGFAHGILNAGGNIFGIPVSPSYSYELKDSILCKS